MHVVAPKEASTCRSKGAKEEWIERTLTTLLRAIVSKNKWRWWKIFRGRTNPCLLWFREKKEIQEWNEQKMPRVLPSHSGGRLLGRTTKVKAREEGEEDEDSGERRIRNEIVHEVITGIIEKTSAHEEAKTIAQRTAGQTLMRSWHCSQIENEEEEEEKLWHNENQMEMQWAEDGRKFLAGYAKGN